ncbi:hypothetical protein BGX23_004364, partial [Mortierella sp. AD031]
MAVVKSILRTHYGSYDTPGSLAFNISMIGRKRIDRDAKNYHDVSELLKNTFDAMVRRIWLVAMGKPDGRSGLAECLKEEEERQGDDKARVAEDLVLKANIITDKLFLRESELLQTLDPVDINAVLFLRDMCVYLELCASIKAGDIDRLEAVLGTLTIININKKVKECIRHQGSNRSMDNLQYVTTPNVRTLEMIATNLEEELGVPYNSGFHRTTSAEEDIRTIMDSLVKHQILCGEARSTEVDDDHTDHTIVKN